MSKPICVGPRGDRRFTARRAATALVLAIACLLTFNAPVRAATARTFVDFEYNPPVPPSATPANWNQYNLDDAFNQRQINLLDEVGNFAGVKFRFQKSSPGASAGAQNQSILTTVAPTGLPDILGFGDNLTVQTPSEQFQITGLQPNSQYDFWLLTYAYKASFLTSMNLSVSGAGATWTQVLTPQDTFLAINGVNTDTAHTFDSYAKRFTTDATGNLTFTATSGQFVGVFGFAFRPVPEPAAGATLALLAAGAIGTRRRRRVRRRLGQHQL